MKDIKIYLDSFKCEKCNKEFNRKCSISKHFTKFHHYTLDELNKWKLSVKNVNTLYEKEFYERVIPKRVKTLSERNENGISGFDKIGNKISVALLKTDESGKSVAQRSMDF